jgi:hypothetical protein
MRSLLCFSKVKKEVIYTISANTSTAKQASNISNLVSQIYGIKYLVFWPLLYGKKQFKLPYYGVSGWNLTQLLMI